MTQDTNRMQRNSAQDINMRSSEELFIRLSGAI